jgi:hypothetical protein
VEWWEPDPSKYLLWALEKTGLAWDVCWDHAKKPPGEEASWDAATVVPQAEPTSAGRAGT